MQSREMHSCHLRRAMQNIKSTNEFSKEQATSENTKREKNQGCPLHRPRYPMNSDGLQEEPLFLPSS